MGLPTTEGPEQGPPVFLNVTWETPPNPGFLVSRIEVGWGMLEGRKRFRVLKPSVLELPLASQLGLRP